ncbi:hypothetical protein BDF14DRAFT_1841584 [Spinellus fusiger]|nr:hypothetical protein BDF14DRAFT_1841584 [Spinellus fusiger]
MLKSVLIPIIALVSLVSAQNGIKMKFSDPNANTVWETGKNYTVYWEGTISGKESNLFTNVKLGLHEYPSKNEVKAFKKANKHSASITKGSMEVYIPRVISPSQQYTLYFKGKSHGKNLGVITESDPFVINTVTPN